MIIPTNSKRKQLGFSLIELLIVVMIIGVIAAIGTPVLLDARVSAQRSAAISSLRRIHGAQSQYRISYSRYANMGELNTYQNGGLGQTLTPEKIFRSGYNYENISGIPTTANVESGFTIEANGFNSSGAPEKYMLFANGSIIQRLPAIRSVVDFN